MMFLNRESTHLFTHTLATSKAAGLEGKPNLLKCAPLFNFTVEMESLSVQMFTPIT